MRVRCTKGNIRHQSNFNPFNKVFSSFFSILFSLLDQNPFVFTQPESFKKKVDNFLWDNFQRIDVQEGSSRNDS